MQAHLLRRNHFHVDNGRSVSRSALIPLTGKMYVMLNGIKRSLLILLNLLVHFGAAAGTGDKLPILCSKVQAK